MVEEILPGLYRIEIPLPNNPLKAINSYLIKGQDRFLLIDTGMNREECKREMFSNLKALDVDLKRTDFFITHTHADHLGLAANLATDTSKVYFNQKEASMFDWFRSERHWQEIYAFYHANGFPEDELKQSLDSHPGRRYSSKHRPDFYVLEEDDTIEIGDYSFTCIDTPGHSPGHMCLYEPRKKILVSGDHVLLDITPNITVWQEMKGSLRQYLASLEKVYSLDVNLVLPGHRSIWHDLKGRVLELKNHHQARLNEALSALEGGEKSAYDVAPHITWDVDYSSWATFPVTQKFFAVGETIAHLDYLEQDGMVRRSAQNHGQVFALV